MVAQPQRVERTMNTGQLRWAFLAIVDTHQVALAITPHLDAHDAFADGHVVRGCWHKQVRVSAALPDAPPAARPTWARHGSTTPHRRSPPDHPSRPAAPHRRP